MIPANMMVSMAKLRLLNRTSPNTMSNAMNPPIMETIGSVKLPNPTIDNVKKQNENGT